MKTLSKMSLRKQTIIITIISSVIPLLLLSVFSLRFMNKVAVENMESRLDEILFTADGILNDSIEEHKQKITNFETLLHNDGYLEDIELNKVKISTMMHQLLMVDGQMMNMYLVEQNGTFIGTTPLPDSYELPKFQNWGIFNRAKENKGIQLYPNYGQNSEKFFVSYSLIKEISREDGTNLYIILDVSTEYIQKLVNSIKGSDLGYIQFIITSSNNQIIYNDSFFTSPISYLDNVFRYDRINASDNVDINNKLEEVTIKDRANDSLGINIYGLVPNVYFNDQTKVLAISTSILIIITAFISGVLGYLLTKHISKPIYEIAERMKKYRPFNLDASNRKMSDNELLELQIQFDKLIKRVEKYNDEDLRKQELLRISEIKALMSQINPHFLNNTLDSIKWKAKLAGNQDIADMITELSSLLKASMNTELYVTIEEEVEFVESYISIQLTRYGNKLRYKAEIDEEALKYIIPKLIIQPIIENAIVHGIEPLDVNGIIKLRITKSDNFITIVVSDNGVGTTFNINDNSDRIGVKNVRNRLLLHYGESCDFIFHSKPHEGTSVIMKIPLNKLEEI